MAWQIEYSSHAGAFLEELQRDDAVRIIQKLEQAAQNPEHFAERLSGSRDFKIRAGDYSAIVQLIQDSKTIYVKRIGHRKNIYK